MSWNKIVKVARKLFMNRAYDSEVKKKELLFNHKKMTSKWNCENWKKGKQDYNSNWNNVI